MSQPLKVPIVAADEEYSRFSAAMLLKQCNSDTRVLFKEIYCPFWSPFSSLFCVLVTSLKIAFVQ